MKDVARATDVIDPAFVVVLHHIFKKIEGP